MHRYTPAVPSYLACRLVTCLKQNALVVAVAAAADVAAVVVAGCQSYQAYLGGFAALLLFSLPVSIIHRYASWQVDRVSNARIANRSSIAQTMNLNKGI